LINRREKLLLEAIVLFEQKANELIKLLASEHSLNLEDQNPFGKLITRKNDFSPIYYLLKTTFALLFVFRVEKISLYLEKKMNKREVKQT
jgi:hypothetical protein